MKIIQVKTHKSYIIKKRSNNKVSFVIGHLFLHVWIFEQGALLYFSVDLFYQKTINRLNSLSQEDIDRESLICYNKSSSIAEMAAQSCIIRIFAVECWASRFNAYIIGITSTTVTLLSWAAEFREIKQNKGCYAVQYHWRSPISVTIESPLANSRYDSKCSTLLRHATKHRP